MSVALRGSVLPLFDDPSRAAEVPAVIVDLSGGGARLCLRHAPRCRRLRLSVTVPDAFVEEWAQRTLERHERRSRHALPVSDRFRQACARVRALFNGIEAHVVSSVVQELPGRTPVHLVSVAFARPQEAGYRLVRYCEREAVRKGVGGSPPRVATAA
jgi:hypothetical protein